ncbi:hypothetical protein OS493_027277 [Desmophyllum pertusum]|uniref:Uncharacterized protein n=1 Tax=Desmophyllum pertusum TaxID=174260 RepID=A0A9X0CW39_9CNID|nr:hypothetical protein OS493_027277 [Desmophyllum pertusum]
MMLNMVNMIMYKTGSHGQLQGQETVSSMDFLQFSHSFQTDISIPRWIITLVKRISVFTVAVDLFVNCCGQHAESVTMLVTDDNGSYSECGDTRISYNPTTLLFQCTPPRSGKYVILEFFSQQRHPPASSAAVSGFGELVHESVHQQYATEF